MAELHYISAGAGRRRRGRAAGSASAATSTPSASEDFFFEYVREQLVERYGAQTVAQGGLKVYTTIDLNMQRQARKAIAEVLNEPEDPAAAIVTINPANGNIEAMAESAELRRSRSTTSRLDGHRQPGSTFKAIVPRRRALARGRPEQHLLRLAHALTGLAAGLSDLRSQNLRRRAERLDQPRAGDAQIRQHRLRAARGRPRRVRRSPKWPTRWASSSPLNSYAAEALGGLTLGVTPLEMANVYATLADGGWRNTPIAITKVVFPDGHVDNNWGKPHRVKVLSEGVTAEETQHPQRERRKRHGRCARRSTARRRPRRARRANWSTPGSTATRPTTRRRCGWATRTSASR